MKIIGVTGKPAAGKSVVSKEIASMLGVPMVEMGDIVEQRAADYLGVSTSELTSNQKGEAATELREEYGETVFAEATVNEIQDKSESSCVVSGVRTPEEVEVFESNAEFTLVLVTAPFETRYQRFTGRGREDESSFSRDDFRNRNERELGWGLQTLLERNLYDVTIENDESMSELSSTIEFKIDRL